MRTRVIVLATVALIVIVAVTTYAMYASMNNTTTSLPEARDDSSTRDTAKTSDRNTKGQLAAGRYDTYSDAKLAASGYDETIIFFHAPWCPECRGFDQAIKAGSIPKGVQILKADYDSSTDLRKKYGVTIQSTFVKVDGNGNKQTLWSGYGKDKSVFAILENT